MRKDLMGQILRFAGSGVASVGSYYILLILLTEVFGVWYLASSMITFAMGYWVNFALQKWWTFRNRDKEKVRQQLALHLTMHLGNMALNTVSLYLLVEYVKLQYLVAQIILTFVLSAESYFISRWIFTQPTTRQ